MNSQSTYWVLSTPCSRVALPVYIDTCTLRNAPSAASTLFATRNGEPCARRRKGPVTSTTGAVVRWEPGGRLTRRSNHRASSEENLIELSVQLPTTSYVAQLGVAFPGSYLSSPGSIALRELKWTGSAVQTRLLVSYEACFLSSRCFAD